MKKEKLVSLSRDEQRYSAALKLWLCRNIALISDYLQHGRFENLFFQLTLEGSQEYFTESYLYFGEIVSNPKEVNGENKTIDSQNEDFPLQRNGNQKKIIEFNVQSENLDFISSEIIQEFKFENIFN
jgi:hypothetical protein